MGVDLSWKSSQIEGNTYSLLETERLLKDKQTASGKTKEEAIMLLNHKDALDFVLDVPDYLKELSVHQNRGHSFYLDKGVGKLIEISVIVVLVLREPIIALLIMSFRFVRLWKILVHW